MSNCTRTNGLLTPCDSLGKVIGSVNSDPTTLDVSKISVHQIHNEDNTPKRDVVYAVSSQGDNTPLVFKYCPFCQAPLTDEV